jgi:hypothetical protein
MRPSVVRLAVLLLLTVPQVSSSTCRVAAAPVPVQASPTASAPIAFPNRPGSLKFAVLGDFGTGRREQYELAGQMASLHQRFPFELVVLVGDNILGGDSPRDYQRKFEIPYAPLLDEGVRFYASLGNHDARNQRFYGRFNMGGKLYYSFRAPEQSVRFFALESTYPEPRQIAWVDKELKDAAEDWKILFFHHPLYSSGETHGSQDQLRARLEPLFVQGNVSVVFSGHDHFYERVKPQKGITYFVVGSGGRLRRGNVDTRTGLTAKAFDTDLAFLAVEIWGDELTFNAISRTGQIVDSGIIERRRPLP